MLGLGSSIEIMKKVNKNVIPNRLAIFKIQNPEAEWEQEKGNVEVSFRCSQERYIETQQYLRTDQGNICAYCEVDLLAGSNGSLDDCRIEHFHPKSKRELGEINWGLSWENLFVVCCGGNHKNVIDNENRFELSKSNYTCDVLKKDKILDGLICKPTELPDTNIWSFERSTGKMSKNINVCQQFGVTEIVADRTLAELNLNVKRLTNARSRLLNSLTDQMKDLLQSGFSIPEARARLAEVHLKKNRADDWPSFFSAIRFFLKNEGELVLQGQVI
jgi:uncharacterized protein (TIGR02646 family)